jgi:hypothetical protein
MLHIPVANVLLIIYRLAVTVIAWCIKLFSSNETSVDLVTYEYALNGCQATELQYT